MIQHNKRFFIVGFLVVVMLSSKPSMCRYELFNRDNGIKSDEECTLYQLKLQRCEKTIKNESSNIENIREILTLEEEEFELEHKAALKLCTGKKNEEGKRRFDELVKKFLFIASNAKRCTDDLKKHHGKLESAEKEASLLRKYIAEYQERSKQKIQ